MSKGANTSSEHCVQKQRSLDNFLISLHNFLPRKSTPAKCHLDRVSHLCTAWSLYFTVDWPLPLPKTAPSPGRSEPPPNTWLLGPTWVHSPNDTSVGSVYLQGSPVFTTVTDRHRLTETEHAKTGVATGCIIMLYISDAAYKSCKLKAKTNSN